MLLKHFEHRYNHFSSIAIHEQNQNLQAMFLESLQLKSFPSFDVVSLSFQLILFSFILPLNKSANLGTHINARSAWIDERIRNLSELSQKFVI